MQLTQPTSTPDLTTSGKLNLSLLPIAAFSTITSALTESQSQTLQAARQALLTPDKPHLLKVISYLRISCAVMRAQRQEKLDSGSLPRVTFTTLMQSLYAYDSEWWKHCQVSVAGRLTSNDAVIAYLLQPVDALHQL